MNNIFLRNIWAFVVICFGLMWHTVSDARSLKAILESKEIRFCLTYPYEPFVQLDSSEDCKRDACKFSGIIYEEAIAFAKSLGQDIVPKFIRIDWDEQFYNHEGKTVMEATYTPEFLASGMCDCYPNNLTKTDWRERKMDIVTLYSSRMMAVVHKSKQTQYKTPADLGGKHVLVEKSTFFHSWAEEQNKTTYANNPMKIELMLETQARKEVNLGIDAVYITDADVAIWSTRNLYKDSVVVFPLGNLDEIGWGFRKEDQDLKDAVQIFFNNQRSQPDSVLNRIWKKFFGRSLTDYISLMMSVK
ncbi:MAG: transporter substrate-binding domain-containing protein [Desulfobacterales bacterium]|nr:transporter substrate-binding domain-containing protein [Desulfobacterales bacterium]